MPRVAAGCVKRVAYTSYMPGGFQSRVPAPLSCSVRVPRLCAAHGIHILACRAATRVSAAARLKSGMLYVRCTTRLLATTPDLSLSERIALAANAALITPRDARIHVLSRVSGDVESRGTLTNLSQVIRSNYLRAR